MTAVQLRAACGLSPEPKKHKHYALFKQHGLRVKDVADYLGVGYSTCAHLMNCYRKPTAAQEARLEELAGLLLRSVASSKTSGS